MSVIEIINQIEAGKKERHSTRTNALILEIEKIASTIYPFMHKEIVSEELYKLIAQNKIRIGKTINNYYIEWL